MKNFLYLTTQAFTPKNVIATASILKTQLIGTAITVCLSTIIGLYINAIMTDIQKKGD